LAAAESFFFFFARARPIMAGESVDLWPIRRGFSCCSIMAAGALPGKSPTANAAKARENVASRGMSERRSADPPPRRATFELIDQHSGGGEVVHHFCDESPCNKPSVILRSARVSGNISSNTFFDVCQFKNGDQFLLLVREWTNFLFKDGKK
jgi:hypothetical protein